MDVRAAWPLLRDTYAGWSADNAARLGAALAYYTAFSLSPLLVIAIGIAGLAFGQEAAQGLVQDELRSLLGTDGASAVEDMIRNARRPASGILALAIGTFMLLFGASGVFGELQNSLNTVWGVQPRPDAGWGAYLKDRFFSFALVLGTGFLLLVSLVLSAALAAATKFVAGRVPAIEVGLPLANVVFSFVVVTVLFALMFKILPDATVHWRDVWVGAAVTAVLFAIGKFALGLYLGRGSFSSSYGAAGSVLVVLLWVYYASQILFFGAEFTKVWANRYGSRVRPEAHAEAVRKPAAPAPPPPQRRAG